MMVNNHFRMKYSRLTRATQNSFSRVTATLADGSVVTFKAISRIDTPQEVLYYQHGGILPYVLRQLLMTR